MKKLMGFRISCLVVTMLFLLWGLAANIDTAAQTDEATQQMAGLLDTNGNRVLDDAEIRDAIQLWILGQTVPGSSQTIDDVQIRELIQIWILGETLEQVISDDNSSGEIKIDKVVAFTLNSKGDLVTSGPALQSAPAGSMVTLVGRNFPLDPVIWINDRLESGISNDSNNAVIVFLPVDMATDSAVNAHLVVARSQNQMVEAGVDLTMLPSVALSQDPKEIVETFFQQLRRLATDANDSDLLSQVDEALSKLDGLSNEVINEIATIVSTNNLALLFDEASLAAQQANHLASNKSIGVPFMPSDEQLESVAQKIGKVISRFLGFTRNTESFIFLVADKRIKEGKKFSGKIICEAIDREGITEISLIASKVNEEIKFPTRNKNFSFTGQKSAEGGLSFEVNAEKTGRNRKGFDFECSVTDKEGKVTSLNTSFIIFEDTKIKSSLLFADEKKTDRLSDFQAIVNQPFKINWEAEDPAILSKVGLPTGIMAVVLIDVDRSVEFEKGRWAFQPIKSQQLIDDFLKVEHYPAFSDGFTIGRCSKPGRYEVGLTAQEHPYIRASFVDISRFITCVARDKIFVNVDPPTGFAGSDVVALVSVAEGTPPYRVTVTVPWGAFEATTNSGTAIVPIKIPKDQKAGSYKMDVSATDKNNNFTEIASEMQVFACPGQQGESIFGPHQGIEMDEGCPKDKAPIITDIDAPDFIYGDGEPHVVTVEFEDPDGDLTNVRFQTLQGPGITNPPQTFSIPNVLGLIEGEFQFSIFCQNTTSQPFNITDQIVLIDKSGLESESETYTYTCEGLPDEVNPPPPNPQPPPNPPASLAPVIESISFPMAIPIGTSAQGTILFSDADGDLLQVNMVPSESTPGSFNPALQGQTSGSIAFLAGCGSNPTPRIATVIFTLQDSQGNLSQPQQLSYSCTPSQSGLGDDTGKGPTPAA